MKKTFYATCVPGLEGVVETLLRREPGVVPEWSVEGAVLFRGDQTPNFSYLHNVFLVLHTMRGLPDLDAAVKKLLVAGDWLDRMPFDQVNQPEVAKRFRIVTMHRDQLAPVNMRYLSLLEQVIHNHTGMTVRRERPDVELWLIRCGERATVFAWRLTKGRADKTGAIRADLRTVMTALAGATKGSAVYNSLDGAACARVADGSLPTVAGRLPAGGSEMRAALREVGRMLTPQGRAALLANQDMSVALDQTPGLAAQERYALRIGGRIHHLWVIDKE